MCLVLIEVELFNELICQIIKKHLTDMCAHSVMCRAVHE